MKNDEPAEQPKQSDPRRMALLGLVITLLLVLAGVLLAHALGRMSEIQDCAMSGRTNCAPIDSTAPAGG